MRFHLRTALFAAVTLIGSAAPSTAGFLDFTLGTTTSGGAFTIGANTVQGSGIMVTSAAGQGTNSNDGVTTPVTNGVLSFTTGNLVSTDALGNQFYANGGSVTVTGTFQGFTGTLFSGSFTGGNVQLQNQGGNNFRLLGGEVTGSIAQPLASFYNFNMASSTLAGLSILVGGPGSTPTVNSGNLALTTLGTFSPAAGTVPEPASFVLLATGLVGAGAVARRKRLAA